ncbi:hypothetical protein SNEBB_001324 [Seison nebaliae]|nr:hypothetical protein SNEBB_001324 [Seison nebaliae]
MDLKTSDMDMSLDDLIKLNKTKGQGNKVNRLKKNGQQKQRNKVNGQRKFGNNRPKFMKNKLSNNLANRITSKKNMVNKNQRMPVFNMPLRRNISENFRIGRRMNKAPMMGRKNIMTPPLNRQSSMKEQIRKKQFVDNIVKNARRIANKQYNMTMKNRINQPIRNGKIFPTKNLRPIQRPMRNSLIGGRKGGIRFQMRKNMRK